MAIISHMSVYSRDDAATVTAVDQERGLSAVHSSFHRGGCLYAGTVTLRNTKTGDTREVDITSRAVNTPEHARYLIGLAAKHVGGVEQGIDWGSREAQVVRIPGAQRGVQTDAQRRFGGQVRRAAKKRGLTAHVTILGGMDHACVILRGA